MTQFDQLAEHINTGDYKACISLINACDSETLQKLRTSLSKIFKELTDKDREIRFSSLSTTQQRKDIENQLYAARICVYGVLPLNSIEKLGWQVNPDDGAFCELVITEFNKPLQWVDTWVASLSERSRISFYELNALYQKGYCNKPTSEHFYIKLIQGFGPDFNIDKEFTKDSELAQVDIWKLFEVEGTSDCNLAGCEIYGGPSWSSFFLEQEQKGVLPREKLLICSLNALDQDFIQKRAGWFSRFHEQLKPSIEERKNLESRYCHLLGSQIPPTVTFALKALNTLAKNKQLDVELFMQNVEPVLYAKAKGTVLTALKLLNQIAKQHAPYQNQIALLAAVALLHEHADVHKLAIDLIETFGDKNDALLSDAIGANVEMVAASQKHRLSDWLEEEQEVPVEQIVFESDYDPFEPIMPVASFNELLELLTHLIECQEDPISLERALDGVVRFADIEPNIKQAKGQALLSRANKVWQKCDVKYFYQSRVSEEQYLMAAVTKSYLENMDYISQAKHFQPERYSIIGWFDVLLEHSKTACKLSINESAACLLAFPTHGRGFINPNVLIDRFLSNKKNNVFCDITEQALALLRLDKRIAIKPELLEHSDEFVNCVKFALGHTIELGNECALWLAASRIRQDQDVTNALTDKFGYYGPDGFEKAEHVFKLELFDKKWNWYKLICKTNQDNIEHFNIEHISTLTHQKRPANALVNLSNVNDTTYDVIGESDLSVRWSATVWPYDLDAFFAQATMSFSPDENSSWYFKCYFEPLLKGDVQITPVAALLLSIGFAAVEACQKGVVLEATIQAIADERLDLDVLAKEAAFLLPSGYITVGRWTKMFKEIATISPKHGRFICQLIPKLLTHDPADAPRDMGGLLELLNELEIEFGLSTDVNQAISYYKNNKKGGKQGKACKALLKRSLQTA
ncbi:hypothetical protein AN214_01013 [Pseudoalteromonas sp. P1-9]|uniref:DUF6493 family protein n=1 Tax=Pseudoalteromonas sp. P1-9 TaxID=1710354 RepID=UPI0006D63529|nr:DUF6493 family protein [Pseudoalteromonas sp. P1-9]KPV96996.1 hypothetical protein AN214_01013 [Pseudoalteromonas sp. P1-9]